MKKNLYDILNKIAKSQIDDTTDPVDNDSPFILQGACCVETWTGQVDCRPVNVEVPANRDPQQYIEYFCERPLAQPGDPGVTGNHPKRGVFTPGATCDEVDCYEVLGMEEPEPSGPSGPEIDGESCKSICAKAMGDCVEQQSIYFGCTPTKSISVLMECLLREHQACLAEKDPFTVQPPYQSPCDYYSAKCSCEEEYIRKLELLESKMTNCYETKVGQCIMAPDIEEECIRKLESMQRKIRSKIDSFKSTNCDLHERLCFDFDPTNLRAKCKNAKTAVSRITRDFERSNKDAAGQCLRSKDRNDHCGRCQCGKDKYQRSKIFKYQMCQYMHSIGCIDNAELAKCEPDFTCFSRPEDCPGISTKQDCKKCREEGEQNPSGPGPTRPGRTPTTPRPGRNPTSPTRRNPRTETDG